MKRAISTLVMAMFAIAPVAPAIAQSSRQISPVGFPSNGTSVQALVPKGWQIEGKVEGDLNGDRRADTVLRLIQTANSGGDRARMLLVLQRQPNGQWQRIGMAPRLLLCSNCGGMLESIQIKIENGVLLVDQLRGSRDGTQTLHRFWIDKASKRLVLIGQDVRQFDRLTGDATRESSNFLTGQKIAEKYRANKQRTETELVSRQRSTVAKTTPAIETVNIDAI
ncbi:hypothetical protein [Leptolyngbya sp. FACHB-17]|uniref:hypothetical protein n=1 Tax=unclassified Leptolyngbya TaxID=2650499 RepID=UPI00168012E5|nr:hypothetical protein [Leptolyngbya sp. FACHB-17]MBD2080897.1 hypothetical protein [Leptolyngbya sp. FACHB-17]